MYTTCNFNLKFNSEQKLSFYIKKQANYVILYVKILMEITQIYGLRQEYSIWIYEGNVGGTSWAQW